MKRKELFLWIDDDQSRERDFDILKKKMGVDGRFENVSGKNVTARLDEILSEKQLSFDLILIDQFLDSAQPPGITRGSTAAEYIREKQPDCPIIGVTAAEKVIDIDSHKKSMYEEVISVISISEFYNTIFSIARSYNLLKRRRPQNNEELMKLLKAPIEDKDRLVTIVPEDIKRNYKDKSLLINISRWVRQGLMSRPGFLYDSLWCATLIGLKEDSFGKVSHVFEKAKFTGIFSDEGKPRWWRIMIHEILFSKYSDADRESALPWHLGRRLSGITKRDYSVCHVCGKEFPETVGYTDEEAGTRAPMHLRCSYIHPNFESALYYDDVRIMAPAT